MENLAVIALVAAVLAPLVYVLGSILGTLRAVHRELTKIRLATESLHDHAVPDLLMKRWERERTR